jgi:hypothetical protein
MRWTHFRITHLTEKLPVQFPSNLKNETLINLTLSVLDQKDTQSLTVLDKFSLVLKTATERRFIVFVDDALFKNFKKG